MYLIRIIINFNAPFYNTDVKKYQNVHLLAGTTSGLLSVGLLTTAAMGTTAELPPTGSLRCSSCTNQQTKFTIME